MVGLTGWRSVVSAGEVSVVDIGIPPAFVDDLGVRCQLVDEETVVMIVSDHGFKASGSLPRQTGNVDLRFFGIDMANTTMDETIE